MSEQDDQRLEADDQQPFKVKDRRRFDAEGDEREDAEDAGGVPFSDEPAPSSAGPLPTIDFITFILSLSTSVMVHLGEAPHPDGTKRAELELARQTVDIIGMLKDKTAGNLTADEDKLVSELLYDLRMRYVQARG